MIKGTKELIQYNICGIYFLIHETKIVYIGQGIDIHVRISTHIQEDKKIFDEIRYIECAKENLNQLEKSMIVKYHPKYNIQYNRLAIKYAKFLEKDISDLTVKEFIECNNINEMGYMKHNKTKRALDKLCK